MDPSRLRKRQMARRLGVSEQVLDQYLQLKRAEVLQPVPEGDATGAQGVGGAGDPPKGTSASGGAPLRWTRRLHPVSAARRRELRRE